jgi:protein phosphatase
VPIQVDIFAVTDLGLGRPINEDAVVVGDLDRGAALGFDAPVALEVRGRGRGPLCVVCDGMGGAAGGEVASKLAAEVVLREMAASRATQERAVYARHLRSAIRAAHQAILSESKRRSELRGMGSTISAVGLVDGALILAQVGDSRAYVERGRVLIQVTRDQSVVSALVHAGRLSDAEARLSDQRSLILQALGAGADVDVALSIVELRRGDRLLLCTDGLHGPVGDAAIRFTLASHPTVDGACKALLHLAHQGGAPDNTSLVVARFDGDLPDAAADEVLRFIEFDPRDASDGSIADTSWVARRLAVKAGLRDGTLPPMVPATGQHRAVVPDDLGLGPAAGELERSGRLGLVAWLLAAALIGALTAYALLGFP